LVIRNFGKGRVAYLTGSLEAVYYESRIESLPKFMTRLVDYLLGKVPQPYRLEGPAGVIANLAAGQNALLLHVLCNIGNLWARPVSRVDYVEAPRINIQVLIPTGRKVKAVRLLRRQESSGYRMQGEYVSIQLPTFSLYEGVYIELD
jgi:hypothetical protein